MFCVAVIRLRSLGLLRLSGLSMRLRLFFFFFKQKTAYDISNFAREGHESRHKLKYWTRQPYLGFGVDAHSMLQAKAGMKAENQEGRRALTGCEQTSVHGIDCEQMPVPSLAETGASSLVPPSPFPLSFREGFSPRGICFSDFPCGPLEAVRFATPDSLDKFLA